MNVFPVPIYPWPLPQSQLDRIRAAYERIAPDFAVQPVEAVPGEPGRVLGMGAFPPFLCDLAYVPDPTDDGQIENRLRWLLLAPRGDENGFLIADYLRSIFGPETREVFDA